jgi:hypothetical protein
MEVRTSQCVTHWQKKEQSQHWALMLLVVFSFDLIASTFSRAGQPKQLALVSQDVPFTRDQNGVSLAKGA